MYDAAEIKVKSGKGGDGAISFRHEKFVPMGGPDGGDGGDGGDVIISASPSQSTLRKYNQKRFYKAIDGESGRGKKMHGKKGRDIVLDVPIGTLVVQKSKAGEDELLADLENSGSSVVVARGGKGGLGNIHYASSINQAPHIAQHGAPGEEKEILLELRIIADAGIIGYPNCGKSTLLKASTAAKPKIAAYPFTTLEPVLGVVGVDDRHFILAEIPGLIENAHLGKGLGHDFLRHITRTRVLIHIVDGSSERPVEDYARVNTELGLFDKSLAEKPQVVAVNKIDLPEVRSRKAEIEGLFRAAGVIILFISAFTGEGVATLMQETLCVIDETRERCEREKRSVEKFFHPQPRHKKPIVRKEDDVFIVEAPQIARIMGTGKDDAELYRYVLKSLERMGVNKELRRLGVCPGDKIRCGNLEWKWR